MTENLTKNTFLEKVFNYEKNKEWEFEGKIPAIIDFYADWCGPCQSLMPTMERLADKHNETVEIVKVNIDKNRDLAAQLNIRSIPALFFIKDRTIKEKLLGMQSEATLNTKILNLSKAS